MNDSVILSEVREFVKNFTNFSLFSHLVRFECYPFKGCFSFRKAEILGFFELQDYQKFYKFFFFAFFYDRIQKKNHKNYTIKKIPKLGNFYSADCVAGALSYDA